MAVQHETSASGSRLSIAALILITSLAVTFPLVLKLNEGLFAFDIDPLPRSGIIPGDHLNNYYRFHLAAEVLSTGSLSPYDPYAFALVGDNNDPPLGWLFGPPFALLRGGFGPTVAYNLLVFLALILTGLFGYLWLRQVGVPPGAALVGAIALMVFPAAYVRLTVHLKGFFLWLMPATLWAVEKARSSRNRAGFEWALAAGTLAFVLLTVIEPETGVYFWPLLIVYALGRSKPKFWVGFAPGLVLSIGYLVWFYGSVINPSVNAEGRTFESLLSYSPGPLDLVRRNYLPGNLERYIYPGAGALVAMIGAVRLMRSNTPLGRKAVVALSPVVILGCLGPRAPLTGPLYSFAFEHFAPLRAVQAPGRLAFVLGPIVALGIAVALKDIGRLGKWVWPAVAVMGVLLVIDARAVSFGISKKLDIRTLAAAKNARGVIDLPITNGIDFRGSIYNYGITLVPAPRTGGVTPFLTRASTRQFNRLVRLGAGDFDEPVVDAACQMGATHVIFWEDLFGLPDLPEDGQKALKALLASPRFELLAEEKGVHVLSLTCRTGA